MYIDNEDAAEGVIGSAVPAVGVQIAGKDGSGNLKAPTITAAGAVLTDSSSSNQPISYADTPQLDAVGRLRVSDSTLIESLHFSNTAHPLLVNTSVTGSGTAAFNSSTSSLRLSTTTSSSDGVIAQTKRYFRYTPGRGYLVTLSGNMGAKKNNLRRRQGYFDANNGLFFQIDGSNVSIGYRTNSSGSPVDTLVAQSSWNVDKLDGTGASGITLNTALHNLYSIDFLWHGAGRVRWGIFSGGKFIICHTESFANRQSTPFMRTPALPLRVELTNTGTTASSSTLDIVCFAYQKEANDEMFAPYSFTASTTWIATNVGTTLIPLLAVRPKLLLNSLTNRIPIIPKGIDVMTNQTGIYGVVYLNPTLTGASFNSADANSAVEFDVASTAISGGTKIKEFFVAASSNLTGSISSEISKALALVSLGLDISGSTQDILAIACRSTGGGSNTWASMNWEEYQ